MIRNWIRLVSEENMWKSSLWLFALSAWVLCGACFLDNAEAPDLAGPSTAARSITIRAIPDAIVSDGFSSSVIEAVMQGPNGERVAGATVLFEISHLGQFLDLGNLAPLNGPRPLAGGVEAGPVSASTDGDGVARVRYWAPFRTDQENDITVTIEARESGTNSRGAVFAQADIFLRAANRPSFPGGAACGILVEPLDTNYDPGDLIFFTATQITGATGQPIARYEWDFGDDSPREEGRNVGHQYNVEGDYTITLFTTESISGDQDSCTTAIAVGQATGGGLPPDVCPDPEAVITMSPVCFLGSPNSAPVDVAITFDAALSDPGAVTQPGRSVRLVDWQWGFGDATFAAGSRVTHTYDPTLEDLSVVITLQVTNSCGRTNAVSKDFEMRDPTCN